MTVFVHSPAHPFHAAERHLRAKDNFVARLMDERGSCRLAEMSESHFHTLIKTIIDQQLSVMVAARIAGRLLDLQGAREFSPDRLLALGDDVWRQCGLSRSKISCIQSLANAVNEGELNFAELETKPEEEIVNSLIGYKGIGQWTAEIMLLFSFKRLDILPLGDLALRKAIKTHYRLDDDAPLADYFRVAEQWRPYRSIASWYLWAAFG